jgi:hypothetical protein
MGFFDDVWDDVQSVALAPVKIVSGLAGSAGRATETLATGASSLASGVGSGVSSAGKGIEGAGEGLGGLGKALNNPLFLIVGGGIVLILLLK